MRSSQLIPPPELAPPGISELSSEDRMRLWARMVDEGDEFLLAGFRERCGSDAEARQAFLDWLERRDTESTAAKIRMLKGRSPRSSDGQ
jgi:hypothetical protein